MMKKIVCLPVMLLVAHGTALSMMHTRKIVNNASRIQLQKRMSSESGLIDHVGDAAFLRNVSAPSNLMDANDRWHIRQAYIRSIRQIARIEALGKIHTMSNLDSLQREYLLIEADKILKE